MPQTKMLAARGFSLAAPFFSRPSGRRLTLAERFFQVPEFDLLAKEARKAVSEKAWKELEDDFRREFDLFKNALDTLALRAEFFFRILESDPSIPHRILRKVGTENLSERAVYALYQAFRLADRIRDRMAKLPERFAQYASNPEELSALRHNLASNCERTCVCVCGSSPAPYATSCMGWKDAVLPLSPKQHEAENRRRFRGMHPLELPPETKKKS